MGFRKILDAIKDNKYLFVSGSFVAFMSWRINTNFDSFEKAIKKEKIFDVRKANEQLKMYRELYDPENDVEINSRLLNSASKEDKAKIKQVFQKYDEMDIESLEKQIQKIKDEVEMLEESKNKHQGINLAKIYYGYEPSEDVLKKIRSNYIEHKKKVDSQGKTD
jgi:hypothetical protein